MEISYKKTALAVKTWALYAASTPASWAVLVDGQPWGEILGRGAYSGNAEWIVRRATGHGDSVVIARCSSLRAAKREVERAIA